MSPYQRLSNILPDPSTGFDVSILLADSNAQVAADLQGQLEAEGYLVWLAADWQALSTQIGKYQPDVLILDAQLPGLDPSRLCELLYADDTRGLMPSILMVDPELVSDQNWELECETDALIAKPVDVYELRVWLRSMVRMKRHFDRLALENTELAATSQALELLKSDIIANVSHELSTPLVQVKAAVALLAEDIPDTYEQATRLADMATQALGRLEGVVENIRQLAQSHSIKLGPVLVNEAMDRALRFVERSRAPYIDLERIERYVEDALPPVRADKGALARLLQLLLDNALKFSDPSTPVYLLAERAGPDHIWLGVQDFGVGIPADEQAHIFEAFYQVDTSSTRVHGGTGTGLALALLLAQGMRTDIEVKSAPGKGSTFSCVVPVAALDDFDL